VILTAFALVAVANLSLPASPRAGFAMRGDVVYLGRAASDKVEVVRYLRQGSDWKEESKLPGRYIGPLSLIATKRGVIIADYEGGDIVEFTDDGKQIWKDWVRYPSRIVGGPDGSVWVLKNSGEIVRKIPESSKLEPLLGRFGEEVITDAALDLAPLPDGGVAVIDEAGRILKYARNGGRQVLAQNVSADGLVAVGGSFVALKIEPSPRLFLVNSSRTQTLWEAPGAGTLPVSLFPYDSKTVGLAVEEQGRGVVYLISVGG
jgi:hypothetical protein